MSDYDLNKEMPRIGERAEVLAEWYLRFNGYFPLPNFILHDAGLLKQKGGQLSEVDLLAVRLPYTQEIIEGEGIEISPRADADLDVRSGVMDFIIAEVKSKDCDFNWLHATEEKQRKFFQYALRRFGWWRSDQFITWIGNALITDGCFCGQSVRSPELYERVRLLSIGVTLNETLGVQQILFEDILDYVGHRLFPCYTCSGGRRIVVSDHHQWHPLICEIYNRLMGRSTVGKQPVEQIVEWLFPDAKKPEE